jgi:putative transposase
VFELNRRNVWKAHHPVRTEKNVQGCEGGEGGQVVELTGPKSEALNRDNEAQVVELMQEVVRMHPTWGYRRVWAWLRHHHGLVINKKRVERLMRVNRWQVKHRESTPRPRVTESVSESDESDARWAIDMTSAYTQQDGWLGITAVLDCHDR